MKLEYILELMTKAQLRLEDSHINQAATAIDEAIDELKKIIKENGKMKAAGASAPAIRRPRESFHIKGLILQGKDEEELWANCYLAALATNAYGNPPQEIADFSIVELRKRLEKSDE